MAESKMYKVRILVNREHPAENTLVWIHLAPVRKSIWPKVKDICKKVMCMGFKIFLSMAITHQVGSWAIAFAYNERGYLAYGGEYLFIGAVFFTTFRIIGLIIRLKNALSNGKGHQNGLQGNQGIY